MSVISIRDILKTKLQSISSVQEVVEYPTEEFNGYPAVVIGFNDMESSFETTSENKRIYNFNIHIIENITNSNVKEARRIVEETIDDVIEALDQDQQLAGIVLPSNETMLMAFPVVSEIIYNAEYVTAKLNIKVIVSFDIN
jgi:hypothetical protein